MSFETSFCVWYVRSSSASLVETAILGAALPAADTVGAVAMSSLAAAGACADYAVHRNMVRSISDISSCGNNCHNLSLRAKSISSNRNAMSELRPTAA